MLLLERIEDDRNPTKRYVEIMIPPKKTPPAKPPDRPGQRSQRSQRSQSPFVQNTDGTCRNADFVGCLLRKTVDLRMGLSEHVVFFPPKKRGQCSVRISDPQVNEMGIPGMFNHFQTKPYTLW